MPKKKPKARLRKTIAGIPVSKQLDNAIEPVLRFAGHPLVNDILTGVLLAGADALVDDKKGKKGPVTIADAALSGLKERGPMGLVLAVAAGEIAAHVVAAFDGSKTVKPATQATAKAKRSRASRPPPRG